MVEFTLKQEQLKEYTGSFYSDEIDTTYHVEIYKDKLLLTHQRHEDTQLIPLANDKFAMESERGFTLDFTRDVNSEVIGFFATTGRVKNLKFNKK